MARTKGDGLGKFGGRKKGVPNKVTRNLRDVVRTIIESNIDIVEKMLKSKTTPPQVKAQVFIGLLRYVLPVPTQEDEKINKSIIEDTLEKLNKANEDN